MRIGVLSTSYPQHLGDIAGCFVQDANRELARRGHQVEALIPESERSRINIVDDPTEVVEVPYLRPRRLQRTFYASGVTNNLAASPLSAIGALSFLPSLAHKAHRHARHWDAVISHWCLPCGLIGSQVTRGLPHLVVFHSGDVQLLEKLPLRQHLATAILRGATGLQFVASHLKRRFFALLSPGDRTRAEQKSYVLPMGVHLPASGRVATKRAESDPLRVLTMSRLVPIKGLDDTIRACASLTNIELVCAGSGPEEERLESLAELMGVPLRLPGTVVGSSKSKALAEADVFILSSRPTPHGREEGLPTGLLEAMAAEVPIIASRTGGVTDVLQDGKNALLVEPNQPASLGRALKRLQDDLPLRTRLAWHARQDVEAYRWPVVTDRMLEALEIELGPNTPRPRRESVTKSRSRHRSVESQL